MRFITDDFYLAVEYDFKEKEVVLKYLESLKPDCKCDWNDEENCDECYRLEYLHYGVRHHSDYKINTCITWLRGFNNQILCRRRLLFR